MTSVLNTGSPRRIPSNGLFGEMQPCFVCNKEFHNSETTVAAEVLKELSQIQKTFYDVFGISEKRTPEPFKENPFCRMCERKAREMLKITTDLQALQVQLDHVRDEIATAIVSTYIYSSKENPNFEIKHLIFEKWYDKVDLSNITKAAKSDDDLSPESDVPTPKVKHKSAPEADEPPKPRAYASSAPISKPKRCELEVASLIRQSEERMSCDPNSDKVEEAICSICSKVYRNKDLLEVHLKTHGEDKPFCKICGKSFFGNALLRRHMQQRHPEESDATSVKSPLSSPGLDNDAIVQGTMDNSTASISVNPKAKAGKKKNFVRCETCGKQYQNKKTLQKHVKKEHVAKKKRGKRCTICWKFQYCTCNSANSDSVSVSYQCPLDNILFNAKMGYELHFSLDHPGESMPDPIIVEDQVDRDDEEAYSDHFDAAIDNDLEEEPKYSLESDLKEVKKFKRLHPTYKDTKFKVSVAIDRISQSVLKTYLRDSDQKTVEEEEEEATDEIHAESVSEEKEKEKRPPHILKSVAWKAKGAWFTQEKTTPPSAPTATPKPLNLQSNWKSFLEKKNPKPKPKPKPIPSASATTSSLNVNGCNFYSPALNAESVYEDQTDKDKSEEQQSGSPKSSDVGNNDDVSTDESNNPAKRPNEESSSSVAPEPKKPTDSTYWVDPKNVIQSGSADDPKTTSPFLAKALLDPSACGKPKPPTKAPARKPGPLSMRKLSDITHALRLGLKKTSQQNSKTKPTANPTRGPSSGQITKLARQLRQAGVGINKGRFDPVFQLHPLGGPIIKPVGNNGSSAPALALNVEKDDKKKGNNGSGVRSKPGPASRKAQMQMHTAVPPRLCETSMEEETDLFSLMLNSNPVTVLPSTTVCSPADGSQQIHRSLKRMAGPKSKTRKVQPELVSAQSLAQPTFRFVDVEDLLSRSAREQALADGVFSSNSNSDRNISESYSYPLANGIVPNIPTKPISESDDSEDSEVECIDSASDMEEENVPKIRIRNLESLAEPEEQEEGEIGEDEDDDVMPMEMESIETYSPSGIPVLTSTGVKNNSIRVEISAPAPGHPIVARRGSQGHGPRPRGASIEQTLDALSRINDISPEDMVEQQGIYAYTENSIRNFFSGKTPAPKVASTTAASNSPPTETFVYTISPEDMPIPNANVGESAGPVITNVYSQAQGQPRSETEVPQQQQQQRKPIFIPARITIANSSSSSSAATVTPPTQVRQRPGRKPSPSLISEVDLDALLGL